MIGVIITGHGNFASGMLSAVSLLIGEHPRVQGVDFPESESEEAFKEKLKARLAAMKDLDSIYIMCDILGGTPSKAAWLLCREMEQAHIIYGVNLPMLLELSMSAASEAEGTYTAADLVTAGRQNMGSMKKPG